MAKGNGNPGFNRYGDLQRKYYDQEGIWASSKGWNLDELERRCKKAGISTRGATSRPRGSSTSGDGIFDNAIWNL